MTIDINLFIDSKWNIKRAHKKLFSIELLGLLGMNRLQKFLPKITFLRFHRVFFFFLFLILITIIYKASEAYSVTVIIYKWILETKIIFF
jgi:hypothetical protein